MPQSTEMGFVRKMSHRALGNGPICTEWVLDTGAVWQLNRLKIWLEGICDSKAFGVRV